MQDNSDESRRLLVVGQMKKFILVVTKDFYVYEIPMTSANKTLSELYLGDYKPQHIKDRWPELYKSPKFQVLFKDPSLILDAYTAADSVSELDTGNLILI